MTTSVLRVGSLSWMRVKPCSLIGSQLCHLLKVANSSKVLLKRNYQIDSKVYGCVPYKSQMKRAATEGFGDETLYRVVTAYRDYGYKNAAVDPLNLKKMNDVPQLNQAALQPDEYFDTAPLLSIGTLKGKEIEEYLQKLYCSTLALETRHVSNIEERNWLCEQFENIHSKNLTNEEKIRIIQIMLKAEVFDEFLGKKFPTVKRYGGEGGESAMAFYEEVLRLAAHNDTRDVVCCIAHRGRLNLLTCLLEFPPVVMFRKMKGLREFPEDVAGAGDVLSHLTSSVDLTFGGASVHATMVPNPSHLEAVNPVAMGKTRSKQQRCKTGQYDVDDRGVSPALCLQIHGDGAFSAQGVVAESFVISEINNYSVGGSIHFIVNNQIAYTAESHVGRCSENASDIARMNGNPVIRVNANDPEAVVKSARLAVAYREKFHRDVVVDFVCYRLHGHNEVDEPSFTQPRMYQVVRSLDPLPKTYAQQLMKDGIMSENELAEFKSQWRSHLEEEHKAMDTHIPKANHLEGQWAGMSKAADSITVWDTGMPLDLLRFVGAQSVKVPEEMKVHPTIQKTHISRRLEKIVDGAQIDWSTSEALAFGSLLLQGYGVRVSGQDVGRGTFSQRHGMVVDQTTEDVFVPLNHMTEDQAAFLEIANSALTEEALLGFEFGMSIDNPKLLPVWEAQFGDFFNGAQIMVDTFVSGAESKWLLQSALVLSLPHGMDGMGPEHSSCRLERFLQMSDSKEDGIDGDDVNMQIVHPTTPAQNFHLLRRQMIRNFRKPLIIASPKLLLRYPSAVSSLSEMSPGTTFQPVLGDPLCPSASTVKRVIFVSGKHYYSLSEERGKRGIGNIAIVRVEELCPFPAALLQEQVSKYQNCEDFIWSQEEHRNMGAWTFVSNRFENVVGKKLRYSGRPVHGTPATGVAVQHRRELEELIAHAFDDIN